MTIFSKSDFIVGEKNATTPEKYEISHRTYLYAFNSDITILLVPPDNINNKKIISDYELLEFRNSESNWNTKNTLKITLNAGDVFYIPPYWIYSIKLSDHAMVHLFQYYTTLNLVSTIHHHILHMLQINNVKMTYDSNKPIDFGSDSKSLGSLTDDDNKQNIEKKEETVKHKKSNSKKKVSFSSNKVNNSLENNTSNKS